MPNILIRQDATRHFLVPIEPGETLLGRGEGAKVVLPHASVSRHHARVVMDTSGVWIEDVESQNGTLLNGEKLEGKRYLHPRDKITVGRFNLIFLGDGKEDRFFQGRYVQYLPAWKGNLDDDPEGGESTTALSLDALRALQAQTMLLESARLTDLENPEAFWCPEAQTLTFGNAGMVHVKGFFTWGVLAEVKWDGKRHVLHRRSKWWGTVSHNDVAVERAPLRNGDVVQIGGTRLRYAVDA